MPGRFVRLPVREGGDDIHPIESLPLAIADVILEAGFRSDGPLAVIVIPAEAVRAGGVPGIADDEERRAVRLFQGVVVRGGPKKAAAQRILLFLPFSPVDGRERTGFSRQ